MLYSWRMATQKEGISDGELTPAELGEQEEQAFIQNMIRFRHERDLTQGGLAALLQSRGLTGMYQTTLSRIEQEEGRRPLKFREALAIARALGSSVEEMLQPPGEYARLQTLRHQMTRLDYAEANLSTAVAEVGQELQHLQDARDALEVSDWDDVLTGSAQESARRLLGESETKLGRNLVDIARGVIEQYRLGHHSTGYTALPEK